MLVGLLVLVLVIVAIALVPVLMMATLFRIVDYLSDEDKLEEVRRTKRERRPVDFSNVDSERQSTSTRSTAEETDGRLCPNCGEKNEGEFDRCWNCQAAL